MAVIASTRIVEIFRTSPHLYASDIQLRRSCLILHLMAQIELVESSFPTLKPGVNFLNQGSSPNSSDIYIGLAHRGISIAPPMTNLAKCLVELCDGSHSLSKIYQNLLEQVGEARDAGDAGTAEIKGEINWILEILAEARLIEFRDSALAFGSDKYLPINLLSARKRFRAQENLTTWHPDISSEKSAQELIESRQQYSIIIFGHNHLALTLFTILQASGFSAIRIIDRSISKSRADSIQIAPEEVCGLGIRGSDVGVRRELVIADLARNSRLIVGEDKSFPALPSLIIATDEIPQETLQRWMSEEIAHLAISRLIENRVEIGPLVIPGKSPCLNCLKLWRADKFPLQKEFELISALSGGENSKLEIPSAQVAAIAGMVAIAVIEYFAALEIGSKSIGKNLIGTTRTLDLFDPMNPDNLANTNNYWQPHISCGCQQLI